MVSPLTDFDKRLIRAVLTAEKRNLTPIFYMYEERDGSRDLTEYILKNFSIDIDYEYLKFNEELEIDVEGPWSETEDENINNHNTYLNQQFSHKRFLNSNDFEYNSGCIYRLKSIKGSIDEEEDFDCMPKAVFNQLVADGDIEIMEDRIQNEIQVANSTSEEDDDEEMPMRGSTDEEDFIESDASLQLRSRKVKKNIKIHAPGKRVASERFYDELLDSIDEEKNSDEVLQIELTISDSKMKVRKSGIESRRIEHRQRRKDSRLAAQTVYRQLGINNSGNNCYVYRMSSTMAEQVKKKIDAYIEPITNTHDYFVSANNDEIRKLFLDNGWKVRILSSGTGSRPVKAPDPPDGEGSEEQGM